MGLHNDGPVTLGPELPSNLYELRNNIDDLISMVASYSRRLENKIEQMISLPPRTTKGEAMDNSIAARRPLMSEMNNSVMSLRRQIEILGENVSAIETI